MGFNVSKYYKGFTEPIKKYQKSEKYKSYRRKYEAKYRDENRLMVRYNGWVSVMKRLGKWSEEREMLYLMKRLQ